jgi:hypothetical protein
MAGTLSAMAAPQYSQLRAQPAGVFIGDTVGLLAVSPTGVAIQTTGNVAIGGDLSVTGSLSGNIIFTGNTITAYSNVTALGEFLQIQVAGRPRAIRLWQYQ